MKIKADIYDELGACALSVVTQIQYSDHRLRSTAAFILGTLVVHGKFPYKTFT